MQDRNISTWTFSGGHEFNITEGTLTATNITRVGVKKTDATWIGMS